LSSKTEPLPPGVLLNRYGIEVEAVEPLGAGLINQTFLVTTEGGSRFVLQRLHSIFPAEVNLDMDAVTNALRSRGMVTPQLVRTRSGELWVEAADGVWRLMTYVQGVTLERVQSEEQAYEAGRLLGRFHVALADLDYPFVGARSGIHDTARHLRNLRSALDRHADHQDFERISSLAESILAAAAQLPSMTALPERVVHGDPKISNFIFDAATGEGLCLVDLDTLNRMALPLELGDAFRSWCNPVGEDSRRTDFSAALFRAALTGYAESAGHWITRDECAALVDATITITVELAARFCADALNESYFAWDPAHFPSRSEHNLVRAEGQLAAANACRARQRELSDIVSEVFRTAAD